MIRQFHSPEGVITRELTTQEVQEWADLGDFQALGEIIRDQYLKASTIQEKVGLIALLLGLK